MLILNQSISHSRGDAMIKVYDNDIIAQTSCIGNALKNNKIGLISGDGFQRKAFSMLEAKVNRQYPYTVKIPRSIDEMIDGDFSPAKEIVVKEPIKGPFSDMWFGDSTSGIKLLCGYINGDSRYVFDTELGDAVVHGIMVGATGQGKSVTLNAIIYNACTLYAPWELHLTLSDAKIVEFKSIAQNNPMPQIETVAATGDVYYLLSVIEQKIAEMTKLNNVFATAAKVFGKPCKKIAEFREITGLTLPQNVLIFDEFQTMFTKAGKLRNRITNSLDLFARLGRNAGYHLFLTSQELGSDIPKGTLDNITFRGAMGCSSAVSELILGNAKASQNMGRKGKLIVNLNSMSKDKNDPDTSKNNINVSVPYIDPQSSEIAQAVIKAGHDFGVTPHLNFYDEYDVEYINDFKEHIKNLPDIETKIYLGEPAFVTDDSIKRITLNLDSKEMKNIVVVSPIQTDLMRLFDMLRINALQQTKTSNMVLCANSAFIEHGANELSQSLFFEDKDYEHSQAFAIARSIIYRRLLCLKADKLVFSPANNGIDVSSSDSVFDVVIEGHPELDNQVNRKRLFFMKNLLITDPNLLDGFGQLDDDSRIDILRASLLLLKTYGAADSCLTLDRVPYLNVWILGADRLLGLGVDPKTKFMNYLKKLLFDATGVNVRFTIFCNSIAEFGDIKTMIRWFIFDKPLHRDLSKADIQDDFPEEVGPVLDVYCDKLQPSLGCLKFKKIFYDGEYPGV